MDEQVETRMQQPTEVSLAQILLENLSEVARATSDVVVEQENFGQLAEFLKRIRPIAIELDKGEIKSPVVEDAVESLIQHVQSVQQLIALCTSKSRIYLLTHCRSVAKQIENVTHVMGRNLSLIRLSPVQGKEDTMTLINSLAQDMQQVHYQVKETEERICQTLEKDSDSVRRDVAVQTGLLMDIAREVGVEDASRNPGALKTEIELLRIDVHDTQEPYDLHMMDVIGNIFDNWVQSSEQPSPSDDIHTPKRDHHQLEPLYEAFVCPLTKQVMQDPVTLENAQTYERSAIERWFQECRDNGRAPVCPMTGQKVSTTLKPSIALRNTIEEWTTRNEQAHIDIARTLISAGNSVRDVLYGLKDLQTVSRKNFNKYKIRNAGLIPLIVNCLKNEEEEIRSRAFVTLRILAEDDDESKEAMGETDVIRSAVKCLSRGFSHEQEEAVLLLYELSKSYQLCEKIGATSGAILILVGMTSGQLENGMAAVKADQILANLERIDYTIRQMAENGRIHPLLKRLVEGPEEVRVEMAEDLAEVPLTVEGKARAAETVASVLVEMLGSNSPPERAAALKALKALSTLESNGKLLVETGVLPPLMRDLFVVGANKVSVKLKEVSATVLANVVNSDAHWESSPIDIDGNTLTSEVIVHNFLHLISNSGPGIEAKLLQVLVGLASRPEVVSGVVSHIKSAGATVSLIQFLEAPQLDLRVMSVRLLYLLSMHMAQELADGLRVTTRQLGTLVKLLSATGVMEEQAAAAGLLANLPVLDTYLTRALLEEGALPITVTRLDEVRRGVVRIGAGRYMAPFQNGLVGILLRFTFLLDDPAVLSLAREHNMAVLFTSLLQTTGLEEVQESAAQALENLSTMSKELSEIPDIPPSKKSFLSCFPCIKKRPTRPAGMCSVHGGMCSARGTFCLLSVQAIGPLVACLDHRNTSLVEAAMGALSTLVMDTVEVERGVQVLYASDAIQPILVILQEKRTEVLRQRALWMVERILRTEDLACFISDDPNVYTALVDSFRYGNNSAKQLAEKALKHLNRIPNFSGVYPKV